MAEEGCKEIVTRMPPETVHSYSQVIHNEKSLGF